jgi:peptidoglycan/LPS O-acetylase OafA/YrhL
MSETVRSTPAEVAALAGENHLVNLVRFLAAVAVVVSHARTVLFVDYDLAPHNLPMKILYGLTALGKEAVTVFFVLSGFWVGGAAIRKVQQGRFRWPDYLGDRIIRLWLVLIPGLLLTVVLDGVGMHMFGHASVYAGDARYQGVVGPHGFNHDALLLPLNSLFLQGVFFAPYGSNGPLWSIGYEFWMYVFGAILLTALYRRSKIDFAVIAGVIVLVTLHSMNAIVYLTVWMMGAGIAWLKKPIRRHLSHLSAPMLNFVRIASGIAVVSAALVVRGFYLPLIPNLFLVAIPTCVLLATLIAGDDACNPTNPLRIASWFAASSFSLYVIHGPLLIFGTAAAGVDIDLRWMPDLQHWVLLAGVMASFLAIAWLFASITERHTHKVREWVRSRIQSTAKNGDAHVPAIE